MKKSAAAKAAHRNIRNIRAHCFSSKDMINSHDRKIVVKERINRETNKDNKQRST